MVQPLGATTASKPNFYYIIYNIKLKLLTFYDLPRAYDNIIIFFK